MESTAVVAQGGGAAGGDASPAVEVRNLRVSYGSVRAVDGIELTVRRGETFGLLGPNGAGKTTTLSVLQGLKQPEAGSHVAILGLNIDSQAAAMRQRIGVSLQSTSLFERLTLVELLRFYAACYDRRMTAAEARKLLDRFGLGEKANVYANQLSGGQQQRAALAVALVNDPELVFLDEPTTGLDPQARRNVWEIITSIHAEGRTVVLTSHYMEEAQMLCGRVGIIDRGKIIGMGSPTELIAQIEGQATVVATVELPLDPIRGLPGVTGAIYLGERLEVHTTDAAATSMALQTLAAQMGRTIRDLTIRQPNLEDVFITMTGRTIRPESAS